MNPAEARFRRNPFFLPRIIDAREMKTALKIALSPIWIPAWISWLCLKCVAKSVMREFVEPEREPWEIEPGETTRLFKA